MPVLHLVIPFLNEQATLETVIGRVEQVVWPDGWTVKMTLVDDGSSDDSAASATSLLDRHPDLQLLRHGSNLGKGAALRTGFTLVLNHADEVDLVGVQDADLEYAPSDLARFVEIFESNKASIDAIIGNRWLGIQPSAIRRVHRIANGVLSLLSNRLTGLNIHDMECCYKIIRVPMLRTVLPELDEDHFAIEPQIAAALARHGARVTEVGVSYDPRSFAEGKKIGLRDGFEAMTSMIREWRRSRRYRRSNPK
ncbi:MAG: glycosyltransferase family 2 protein [Planctomycetota bacterium]|nr:glycosyltransferase family 2 protein [Planctomycetota bacterium]MDA1026286.1 glycosyltransferase family 2 protein [Planctomycetota bacterium]